MPYANKTDYKKWYLANRERLIAKARAAELANPEKAAQKKRKYLARHPDRRKETNRRYMKKPDVMERARSFDARPDQRAKAKALRELDRHVVKTIKKLKACGLSAYEVARLACVNPSTIDRIWSGETWRHV